MCNRRYTVARASVPNKKHILFETDVFLTVLPFLARANPIIILGV